MYSEPFGFPCNIDVDKKSISKSAVPEDVKYKELYCPSHHQGWNQGEMSLWGTYSNNVTELEFFLTRIAYTIFEENVT